MVEGLLDLPIVGLDIVEVAPSLDPALTSLFAARKTRNRSFRLCKWKEVFKGLTIYKARIF